MTRFFHPTTAERAAEIFGSSFPESEHGEMLLLNAQDAITCALQIGELLKENYAVMQVDYPATKQEMREAIHPHIIIVPAERVGQIAVESYVGYDVETNQPVSFQEKPSS